MGTFSFKPPEGLISSSWGGNSPFQQFCPCSILASLVPQCLSLALTAVERQAGRQGVGEQWRYLGLIPGVTAVPDSREGLGSFFQVSW